MAKSRQERTDQIAEIQRQHRLHANDISSGCPPVADRRRRRRCEKSLLLSLQTYYPAAFFRPFSRDHKDFIADLQWAILNDGCSAVAMARESGKTTICERSILWAVMNGYRKFATLLGATKDMAIENLESIKRELHQNPSLAADYPEVCYPFQRLDTNAAAAKNQRWGLVKTGIRWSIDRIVFATIPPSSVGGSVLSVAPLTGAVRGLKHTLEDGRIIRPDFVLLDDPQTRKSASSNRSTDEREAIVRGDVMGLGERMAAVMTCTPIKANDLAERFLDRTRHPEWRGRRTKMVLSFPKETPKLEQYRQLRIDASTCGNGTATVNAFWKKHRKALEEGAEVSDPHRKAGCISAIQHAMHLLWDRGRQAFSYEYQCEPLEESADVGQLKPAVIAAKPRGLPRGVVPLACPYVAAYLDVHGRLLYWVISAWDAHFGGGPIAYGTYPDQGLRYFAQDSAPVPMEAKHPGMVEDAYLLAALNLTVDRLLAMEFRREDGAAMRIGRLLVDIRWGQKTQLLKQFVRRHPQGGGVLWAAQGIGRRAGQKPLHLYRREPGELRGPGWRVAPAQGGDRWVTIDANFWKTFAAERLAKPLGTPGGWDLFGSDPAEHGLFADHCCAEYSRPVLDIRSGETVNQWEMKPGNPDNHWWDCLVNSAVAGSMLGATIAGMQEAGKPKRKFQINCV
jgi:hypothetical protein